MCGRSEPGNQCDPLTPSSYLERHKTVNNVDEDTLNDDDEYAIIITIAVL